MYSDRFFRRKSVAATPNENGCVRRVDRVDQKDVAGDHTCDHEYPIVMSGSQLPGNE